MEQVGWKIVDWIYMAQDRDLWLALVNTITNLRVQNKACNFLTNLANISFSSWTLHQGVSSVH
jgi:hypothetical protein